MICILIGVQLYSNKVQAIDGDYIETGLTVDNSSTGENAGAGIKFRNDADQEATIYLKGTYNTSPPGTGGELVIDGDTVIPSDKSFELPRVSQSDQPDTLKSAKITIWHDDDDGSVYISYNDPTEGLKNLNFDADAKPYIEGFSYNLETPATADTGKFQTEAFYNLTVTRVSCSVDSGTVSINIDERAFATPDANGTDVLSAVLVCDTNGQSSCASGCDVNTITNADIDVTDPIALEITATSGTPTILRVHVKFTKDD